jgi:hypothetical protein
MAREKPITLKPLKFKEAVADLLKVKPPKKSLIEKKKQKRGVDSRARIRKGSGSSAGRVNPR